MSAEWTGVLINGLIVIIYLMTLRSSHKMVKETKDMARETKISREESYRPEVIAYFREENGLLYFTIKNNGTRPAFNIHLFIEKFFSNNHLEGDMKFFKVVRGSIRDVEKEIKLLAPNQSIEAFFGINREFQQRDQRGGLIAECPIEISYYNYEGDFYKENYNLTLRDFFKEGDVYIPTEGKLLVEEVAAIREELRKR
ncbi:hypothetical protein GLV98_12280 [Halobacillus litoralis]|uniref:Uncharacterized protein n=1 Tax=Halobacillus litoralis TaxID=45668 RepID=A0A845E7Y9_9BACI|nr:hypothetical protein [Halobacillus litoralis]MYL50266.1 hypothetical protein [Halobacillus litoralis]